MLRPYTPGSRLDLNSIDADGIDHFPDGKGAAKKELHRLQEELAELQERFYVSRKHKLLIILQGMDTSGKNGSIKGVFRAVNPQGVSVASFKKPTADELSRDFLWRVHATVPAFGEIVIFDRSHYEDITAVRVHELTPPAVWRKRFDHICDFERMLADEGTVVLKFFLHIDKDTQKERLESRVQEPHKQWKFETADLHARAHWDQYMEAYNDAIRRTATTRAPWYIVPSNRKWLRNLLIARTIVGRLRRLRLEYPKVNFDPAQIVID